MHGDISSRVASAAAKTRRPTNWPAAWLLAAVFSALTVAGTTGAESKKADRARQVLQCLLDGTDRDGENARQEKFRETLASFDHLRAPPVAASYDFFEVPLAFAARLRRGIGRGTAEALNLRHPREEDPGASDPLPSSFWHRPDAIPELDLYHGFGGTSPEPFTATIWDYAGPKRGSGLNPGFHARAGGVKIRVKFAETKSEPFSARIFWALGYHVDPTYYCPGLKVRYQRRLFEEFNSREEVSTQFRFAAVLPIYTLRMQRRCDPFDYIASALMKDGRRLDGPALKHELLLDADPATGAFRFRPQVEGQIEYLVTVPANVQRRDKPAESIGPWQFEGLGHEDRRELRGAGLLAAWLGWSDCRQQNTRLRVIRQSGSLRLMHYFTDLGGGLGKADGVFSGKGELPQQFAWTFTRPPVFQGRGRMMIPFRITGYRPMEHNEAFERMTLADARWMGRLIGQLTERQIRGALEASGFDSWELRLYAAKLIHRRDRMICDLGLDGEIRLVNPAPTGAATGRNRSEFENAERQKGRSPPPRPWMSPTGENRVFQGREAEQPRPVGGWEAH